jgi:phosphoribosyl-AMP cyclohydrolase
MTIKELTDILKQYPQDSVVVVDGYEDGFTELEQVKLIQIIKQKLTNNKWWVGEYSLNNTANSKTAVYFSRKKCL